MNTEATDDHRARAASGLAQSMLFGSLVDDDRARILDHVEPVSFPAGTTIFERGDAPDALYILLSGGVGIFFHTSDGRKFSIALATVGAVFGEIGVLDGGPRSADAVAVTDIETLMMTREALRDLLATNPRVLEAVIFFLCARVRDTDRKLEAIALQSVEARLARFLLSAVRARTRGTTKGRGEGRLEGKVAITLGVSPSELSLLIGEGRAQVSAAIALLEKEQAFHRDGAQVVCDVAVLARIADQGWD